LDFEERGKTEEEEGRGKEAAGRGEGIERMTG
jgi:hypothetical protein